MLLCNPFPLVVVVVGISKCAKTGRRRVVVPLPPDSVLVVVERQVSEMKGLLVLLVLALCAQIQAQNVINFKYGTSFLPRARLTVLTLLVWAASRA